MLTLYSLTNINYMKYFLFYFYVKYILIYLHKLDLLFNIIKYIILIKI